MKVTGSLQIRNGIYYSYIRVRDQYGKSHQKAKSTGIRVKGKNNKETIANARKANKILDALIREYEERQTIECDELFTKCLRDWLEVYRDSVRFNTWESYKNSLDVHIEPYFNQKQFAKLTIAEITPLHIEGYIRAKRMEGQSVSSIKHHIRILNGTFKRAIRLGWITTNPCEAAQKPKVPHEEKYVAKAYTPEQAKKLLQVIQGDPLESAIMLGLFLGLRKSECLGLRWSDIDFEHNIVYIRNTVIRSASKVIECEQTKSASSHRALYMMPQLKCYLLELRDHQAEMRKLYGDTYHPNNHVCQWDDGRAMSPDYPTHHFPRILKNNNLPRITFHQLRHSAGSILLNAGVSAKQIQQFLGHSDIRTTLDIYTHLTPATEEKTSNVLGALLSHDD